MKNEIIINQHPQAPARRLDRADVGKIIEINGKPYLVAMVGSSMEAEASIRAISLENGNRYSDSNMVPFGHREVNRARIEWE